MDVGVTGRGLQALGTFVAVDVPPGGVVVVTALAVVTLVAAEGLIVLAAELGAGGADDVDEIVVSRTATVLAVRRTGVICELDSREPEHPPPTSKIAIVIAPTIGRRAAPPRFGCLTAMPPSNSHGALLEACNPPVDRPSAHATLPVEC
jgi:hypothetical protein